MTTPVTESQTSAKKRRALPSYPQIVKIMNLIRKEADFHEIEDEIKADPVISYRLMTYINSASMGFSHRIRSFRQAVTIVGYYQLYRWLTMLLVTGSPRDGRSAIGLNAIIRGRFMELIGKVHFGKPQADDLFVVGVFSLLDQLFDEAMEKLLTPLNLSDAMQDALIRRVGPYVPLLLLAEAIENADEARISTIHQALGIDIEVVQETYHEALQWSEKFGV